MPLIMAERGRRVRIKAIHGGHGFRRKLVDMGLVPGMEIEVINNPNGGPMVVGIFDTRIMLGRGMAHRIMVG